MKYADEEGELPQLSISDWPDFPNRGVMMDISRDKVPTLKTLYTFIGQLASWKINQFQLYSEHTFAYQNHKEVWQHYGAFSAEEILALAKFDTPNGTFEELSDETKEKLAKDIESINADFRNNWLKRYRIGGLQDKSGTF